MKMHYSQISIFFAIVFLAVDAEPIRRRRRQSSTIVIPCPVQCSWTFAQAWTKAISFETPTANMIDDQLIVTNNGTLGLMCSLYGGYQQCLRACVASNIEYASISPSYKDVCLNKQAVFDTYLPCMTNNTKKFQGICKNENEHLLAASVRLITQGKFDSNTARQFCRTANDQAFCIFPVLRQTCGNGADDALRSIVNASLVSVRQSIGEEVIEAFYPECSEYFETIENGIPTPNSAHRNSSLTINVLTAMPEIDGNNSTTSSRNDNSSYSPIRRDDADGPNYENPTPGRLIPRLRTTTTPSTDSGTVIYTRNTITFLICSVLFSVFM